MTENDNGQGTRAYRAGKRRVWLVTLIQFGALATIVGAIVLTRDGSGPGAVPEAVAIAGALAIAVLINFGGWWAFRIVDEFEARVSLTAFTVAFYVHMTLYCVWAFLWAGGLMSEPDATTMFLGAGMAALLAYVVLKARR